MQDKPVIKTMIDYLLQRTKPTTTLAPLSKLLTSEEDVQVGLILTERLINIPSEVVPPMYRMLLEEIAWALEEKEPYQFTHYLILSKTYLEVTSKLDEEVRPQKKKKKGGAVGDEKEIFYFHPEDEVLQRHSLAWGGYNYTREEGDGQADARRAFQEAGIKSQGHAILIEAAKFESAVKDIEDFLRSS